MLRDHLAWVQRWGLRTIDLVDVCHAVERGEGGSSLDHRVGVCFDDALVGVHRDALEILRDAGVSATVFVVADALGHDPWWWSGAARAMSAAELLDVVAAGHRIGSHTRTHPSLPSLDDATLERELRDSRASLEDLVQQPVEVLAYPGGHHDARVRECAAAVGYQGAFTFLNGRVTSHLDRYALPRLTMSARQTRSRLAYQLARPAWSWPDHQRDVVPD
jgi:peptidoglycan/xylan/chitin deacetylase (PgdA/CDA1 family)